jgi:hypothetical protein
VIKIFYLSIVFFFSFFAHGMELLPEQENEIVKFNMGGYKCDISLNIIRASESEFFKALVDGKFTPKVDDEGRVFLDCPKSIAKTMHHFMCFYELLPNQDYQLALKTADFFQCDKLRHYIAIKKDLQPSDGWIQISEHSGKLQLLENDKKVSICPICKQTIKYQVQSTDLGSLFVHLIKSHGAEFHSEIRLTYGNIYSNYINYFNFKYRLDEWKEIDETNFSAALVSFEYKNFRCENNWKHSNTYICIFTCPVCLRKFEFGNEDVKYEKAKEHLKVHNNVEILFYSGTLVVYVFKIPERDQ